MNKDLLENIDRLIKLKKINEAQAELSKLGPDFLKNTEYIQICSKIRLGVYSYLFKKKVLDTLWNTPAIPPPGTLGLKIFTIFETHQHFSGKKRNQ